MGDDVALSRLQQRRLREHRISPSRPLRGAKQAAAFVRRQRVVVASGHSSLPVLTEAIAGAHLSGSWWSAAPRGTYGTLLAVARAEGVVSAPLIDGKQTFLDASLGPALERVASDADRVGALELPATAVRLLRDVSSSGEVRMDRWGPAKLSRPARTRLERELLVVSEDLHTESGYHTVVLRPWPSGRFPAGTLSFADARDALALAALRSAVGAPEREARRWFCFGDAWVDATVAAGRVARLTDDRRAWLTCAPGP